MVNKVKSLYDVLESAGPNKITQEGMKYIQIGKEKVSSPKFILSDSDFEEKIKDGTLIAVAVQDKESKENFRPRVKVVWKGTDGKQYEASGAFNRFPSDFQKIIKKHI